MNKRALKVLEYDKVIKRLSELACSPMGRELAENLVPSNDIREVKMMQQETDEAVNIIFKRGNAPIEGLVDIRDSLKKVQIGSMLEPGQLLGIADHLRCARRVKGFKGNEIKESYPMIDELISGITPNKKIEDDIYSCIISEDEVSDRASVTLYNIRKQIKDKNSSIRDRLNGMIRSGDHSKYLQESIITVRGDRFVVPVKSEYRANFPGIVHDQSSTGSTLFIEPMAVVELNNDIRELKLKEKAEIERILTQLSLKVGENIDSISINNDILSRLDFIFAKANLSIELKCMPPIINDEGYINIKNGRHPLINPDKVVPNSIRLGRDYNVLVITGPNTGGKTVTLKTTGLLTLMALAGLQIPAEEGSSISVFDDVLADIGDEQSIEQSLSTFSSHMSHIVSIMAEASEKSLCLFDELGAGTDPTEGAALAMAILDELYMRGSRVVATTHYSELKAFALQRDGIENASVEFNVETLRPTYKLFIGIPGKSNAFEISKRLGLNDEIINKAKEFVSKEGLKFEDLISNLQKDRIAAEQDREKAELLKKEAERIHGEYLNRKERLDKARDAVINEARQKGRSLIKETKEEADEIIKGLRKLSEIQEESERNKKIEEARRKLKDKLDLFEDSIGSAVAPKMNLRPLKNVKPGDSVYISELNQNGIALSTQDDKGEVSVQVGIMKINVKLSDLSCSTKNGSKADASSYKMHLSRDKAVSPSLDLRGQTLDEAILNTDKYLDDAYLSHLNEVTIIHGKGTGVLRQGIIDMLKHHTHVKSYRLGKYGEGGMGVTIVELK